MNFSIPKILKSYTAKGSTYWRIRQDQQMLAIFKEAMQAPAYQKFLKQQGIRSNTITSIHTFKQLPNVSKSTYFRQHPLPHLAKNYAYETESLVMTSTSGSTGEPTYFPRNERIDWQYSVLADFFLNNGPKGSTLLIDCFGMGVWIGGLITYQAFRYAGLRNKPVSIITPGINKKEIFHALHALAPHFKNVIIAGYPPFIKDILDESRKEKIDFTKFHARLLFAAESFTENFRDYVCAIAKIKNPFLDTLNIYGSAELGAMAFETPLSIFIRRMVLKHKNLFKAFFPLGGIPTLAQYNPEFVAFEEQDHSILITADAPTPFIRYKIGDTGGVFTFAEISELFANFDINLKEEARKEKIFLTQLPFVYIHIREDFSTKLYGAIIYPDPVQEALQLPNFRKKLTGKFTMETKTDKRHAQYLEINIELKPEIVSTHSLKQEIGRQVTTLLIKKNGEYKNNHNMIPHKVKPVIRLWPYESFEYFKPGIKQKWVIT